MSTTSVSGAIVIVTGCESMRFAPHESVACTRSVDEPHADGTPAIVPLNASSVRPAGSEPDAIDHVADPIAPPTAGVSWYATPTWPAGAAGIVTTNGGGSTVIVSVAVVVFVGHDGSNASTVIVPV